MTDYNQNRNLYKHFFEEIRRKISGTSVRWDTISSMDIRTDAMHLKVTVRFPNVTYVYSLILQNFRELLTPICSRSQRLLSTSINITLYRNLLLHVLSVCAQLDIYHLGVIKIRDFPKTVQRRICGAYRK